MISSSFGPPVVLAHHGVNEVDHAADPRKLLISPRHLTTQLSFLLRSGYRFKTTEQLLQDTNFGKPPRGTIVKIYDDEGSEVEAGDTYDQLRGGMIEARTEIHRDLDVVIALATELFARYDGGSSPGDVEAAIRAQATKRVALQFVPRRTATWDHRKLAGIY